MFYNTDNDMFSTPDPKCFWDPEPQMYGLNQGQSLCSPNPYSIAPVAGDIYEPIPIHTDRTDRQAAALRATLEDTIRVLFLDCNESESNMIPQVHGSSSKTVVQNRKLKRSPKKKDFSDTDEPKSKKIRASKPSNDNYSALRFRPYQADQWDTKFDELLEFKKKNGDCNVPNAFQDNPALSRWVKRQRYQYKAMKQGKASTMTDRRIKILEKAGFIWDAHEMAWEERLKDLVEYQEKHGDCNVPTEYKSNRQLAIWVKCQRRQYKLFNEDKASTITLERIDRLNKIGFTWKIRQGGHGKR
eukprot:scaffold24_cov128-Cylindrotheca_fusiformis.AAC.13